MSTAKRFVICLSLIFLARCAFADDNRLHAGPLFDHFSLTLSPGDRIEAAGPFFYSEQKETQKTWGVPPLFSLEKDPATESEEFNFAYPIFAYDRFGSEWRWHFVQVFSFAGGKNQAGQTARRFTLFPLYFQQRSEKPDQNYTAVVPFYGHLKNRLFMDEISFVMLPFYLQTRKRDVVTTSYFFPFYHVRRGDGLYGRQLWPITGREHKDVTTKTNGFGDVEIVPGRDTRFMLWPFFFNSYSGIGTTNWMHEQALLPVYDFQRSTNRDSTTVGWPFFSHIVDREKKYREWQTPWPLADFARGEGKRTSRIWPFYSHATNQFLESDWVMWPVWKFNRVHADPLDRTRKRVLFFLYSDMIQANTETKTARRRVDFWPFFTHWRDYNGRTRLQVIAPIEPILPDSSGIEREYSPIWSFWRAEKNPQAGASSQSLLWNLYRRDVTPASKKCSLLFGLFQYQSGSEGKRLRLFYIPVGKK